MPIAWAVVFNQFELSIDMKMCSLADDIFTISIHGVCAEADLLGMSHHSGNQQRNALTLKRGPSTRVSACLSRPVTHITQHHITAEGSVVYRRPPRLDIVDMWIAWTEFKHTPQQCTLRR
ncbi:hypothetical protein PHET_11068 [Paragonimus heterotremus]|uniref:Uncharacterized protein n=1 Tax=Paragonimus heterotremus TaxID=100268 RepID=A0A8J4WDP4_9TREM|nr:hypothetical protein PHET_11068 [Paragonimus heterotremus]